MSAYAAALRAAADIITGEGLDLPDPYPPGGPSVATVALRVAADGPGWLRSEVDAAVHKAVGRCWGYPVDHVAAALREHADRIEAVS